ncbi:MAG: hypothetical protein IIA49_16270 [Bacteroidetes bacterium]|nr:hypothetical protein [Bacteroidota bacterium]
MKIAEETGLDKKINLKPSKIVNPIIADGKIVNIDKTGEIPSKGQIEVKLNELELQQRFDRFVYDNCTPYAPADSSDRMKTALYQFFNKKYIFNIMNDSNFKEKILKKIVLIETEITPKYLQVILTVVALSFRNVNNN